MLPMRKLPGKFRYQGGGPCVVATIHEPAAFHRRPRVVSCFKRKQGSAKREVLVKVPVILESGESAALTTRIRPANPFAVWFGFGRGGEEAAKLYSVCCETRFQGGRS